MPRIGSLLFIFVPFAFQREKRSAECWCPEAQPLAG